MSRYVNRKLLGLFVKTNGVFSKPLFSGIGHILCFHRVLPASDTVKIEANSGMEISPEKLEWIIRYFLDKGYEVISMDQLLDFFKGIRKQKRKFIVLTFDDGYNDIYTVAYPLLKKLGVPFTVYVSPGFQDNKALMWWYFLEQHILNHENIEWQEGTKHVNFKAESREDKNKLFIQLRRQFIAASDTELLTLFRTVMGISEEEAFAFSSKNAMTWPQIAEIAADPLGCIGAHSLSHRPLNKLDEKEAVFEMKESGKIIAHHTGKSPVHFAYPYGSENEAGEREFHLLETAGFKTGVTLRQGNCFSEHARFLMQLPRIPLGEKTDSQLLDNVCLGIRQFSFNGFKKII